MAIEYLYPDADVQAQWPSSTGANHFTEVDDPQGSPDDDTTKIYTPNGYLRSFLLVNFRIGGSVSASTVLNATTAYADASYQFTDAPGSTGWTVQNLKDLEFGPYTKNSDIPATEIQDWYATDNDAIDAVLTGATINSVTVHLRRKYVGTSFNHSLHVTQIYLEVDYTAGAGNHPAPTDLEIDRSAAQTNASEEPIFSAVFQAAGGLGTAEEVQIQVSEVDDFASTVWDSGWLAITSCADGVRCDEKKYAGSTLSSDPPDGHYHVQIRFRDGSLVESLWLTGTFAGIDRAWAAAGYTHRLKLLWDSEHDAIPGGEYTQAFEFQSGHREIVARNGYFNESIQASGGFQIIEGNGRTHILYLGEYNDSGNAGTWIVTQDHLTGLWGKPFRIDSAYTNWDTHNFPTGCIDRDGYIHVFYGCHENTLKYLRSKYPNITGSLPGENTGETLWIDPKDGLGGYRLITGATFCTYPIAFAIPETGRVYIFYRDGTAGVSNKWSFHYSDDNGVNWSGRMVLIEDLFNQDASNYRYRVYLYGLRYDEKRKRLHLSWTHNHVIAGVADVERGIWYAYCDFDETDANSADVGFNIVRWADGSLAGYTTPNPGTQPAVGFDITRAISEAWAGGYGTATLARIFTETLVLTKEGEPVIFWEQKFKSGTPTQETDIVCARWSAPVGGAGAWDIIDLSQQVNLMLRVRRSSISVQTDKDGVIRALMPVNGKTYHRQLPIADVDSVSVTSSEATNHDAIDDGFCRCDGDGSYIDIAADGKASFTFDGVVPAHYQILGVEIEVVARRTAGSATCFLYLDDGVTDEDSSVQSISAIDWEIVKYYWEVNPYTGLAWQPGDLTGMAGGIKLTSFDGARISRIVRRIHYTIASDDKYFSAELWELRSADGGYTWTARESSRNSGIGVPIMNHKHQLTNDTIEFVWCSGHDIFYWNDRPFGIAQKTGIDIRLFYGGVEIDRVLDYTNLNKSRIQFLVQETIPAGRVAGPDDYYLYFGNPNESTQPKADPTAVFSYFENFETYAQGESIDAQNGWSVVSGAGVIYSSPPDHANKGFAGEKSLQTTVASVIERTLGSGLTNVFVEVSFWLETAAGTNRIYFALLDSLGNIWGVGYDNGTDYAGYDQDGSWGQSASVRVDYRHFWVFGSQVTSHGCSAFFMGRQYAVELAAITTVDKLQLIAPALAYWDFIRVSRRLAYVEAGSEILVGAVDQPYMSYDPDHSQEYQPDFDAIHHGIHIRTIKIVVEIGAITSNPSAVTGSFHIRLSFGPTYNDTDIAAEATIDFPSVGQSWVYDSVIFEGLAQGDYSIKVDLYATDAPGGAITGSINKITYDAFTKEPELQLQAIERHGFFMDATIKGAGVDQFIMDARIDGYALRLQQRIPIEHLVGTGRVDRVLLEWVGRLATTGSIHIENLRSMSAAVSALLETASGSLHDVTMPIEILAGLGVTGRLRSEWTGSPSLARSIPIEFLGDVTVGRTALVEIENSLSGSSGRIPVEFHGSLAVDRAVLMQWLASSQAVGSFYIEATREVLAAGRMLSETLEKSEHVVMSPLEIKQTLATTGHFLVEALGYQALEVTGRIPLDWVASLDARGQVHLEHLSPAALIAQLQIDRLRYLNRPGILPMDSLSLVDRIVSIQQEWALRIQALGSLPLEAGLQVATSFRTQVEQLAQLARSGALPIEWSGAKLIEITGRIPISWSASAAIAARLPLSHATNQDIVGGRLLIESGSEVVGLACLPVEIGQGFESAKRILADWLHKVDAHGHIRIESRGWLDKTVSLRIEFGSEVSISSQVPIEAMVRLVTSGQIPIDWIGVAFAAMMIINARLEVPGVIGASLAIPKLRDAVLEVPGITDRAIEIAKLTEAAIEIARILRNEQTGE